MQYVVNKQQKSYTLKLLDFFDDGGYLSIQFFFIVDSRCRGTAPDIYRCQWRCLLDVVDEEEAVNYY